MDSDLVKYSELKNVLPEKSQDGYCVQTTKGYSYIRTYFDSDGKYINSKQYDWGRTDLKREMYKKLLSIGEQEIHEKYKNESFILFRGIKFIKLTSTNYEVFDTVSYDSHYQRIHNTYLLECLMKCL